MPHSLLWGCSLWMLEDPSKTIGIQEEDIRKYRSQIDALESYSLTMNESQQERTIKLAKKLNIPLVSNSDLPINSGFTSYNEQTVDFSSPEKLRESIKQNLRNRSYTSITKRTPKTKEMLKHILIVGSYSRYYSG